MISVESLIFLELGNFKTEFPFSKKATGQWAEDLRKDACLYCGQEGGTVDHIVPFSLWGLTNEANCVGACERCNKHKANKQVWTWFEELREANDPRAAQVEIVIDRVRRNYLKMTRPVKTLRKGFNQRHIPVLVWPGI